VKAMGYIGLRRWNLGHLPHQDAPLRPWSAPFDAKGPFMLARGAGGAGNRVKSMNIRRSTRHLGHLERDVAAVADLADHSPCPVARDHRLQHPRPGIGAAHVTGAQRAPLRIAKLIEHKQRMIEGFAGPRIGEYFSDRASQAGRVLRLAICQQSASEVITLPRSRGITRRSKSSRSGLLVDSPAGFAIDPLIYHS
jgi:hypothetical protein